MARTRTHTRTGLFIQFKELPHLYRVRKIDTCIWVMSFVCTVVLNVREGLMASVVFALLTTVFRQQRPPSTLLGMCARVHRAHRLVCVQAACPARTSIVTSIATTASRRPPATIY